MTAQQFDLSHPTKPLSNRKAQRREIYLGAVSVQIFLLPEGGYCLSQTEVAAVIGKGEYSIRHFLNSKGFKALLGAEFESFILVEPIAVEGANKPINPLSSHVAGLYWYHWSQKGNELARALCQALIRYSIHDLADDAFDTRRSADEKQQQLADDLQQPRGLEIAPETGLGTAIQLPAYSAQQIEQLIAEVLAFRAKAAYRREQISFNLAKRDYVSSSGQICCAPNLVVEKIADILDLRSSQAGRNWIVAHPEIIGHPAEWKMISVSGLVPEWPKDSVLQLMRLAYKEAGFLDSVTKGTI